MNVAALVAFNVLLNGVGSFLIAWLVAGAALRLLRLPPGRAAIAIASVPFAKVAIDAVRGVPEHSFLWLRAAGVPQGLGSFRIGFGLFWIVPRVELVLGAIARGEHHTQSAPDLLAAWLAHRAAWAPGAIAALLIAIGVLRLATRALAWRRAQHARVAARAAAVLVGYRRAGLRRVEILVSAGVEGSPFTGGLLRPYACFPARVWDALSPAERRAALAHELAHVAEHHLALATLVGIVRDVFWFVPFVGRAAQRLHEAIELAADARAVRTGVSPALLASALVRAREATVTARASGPLARSVLRASGRPSRPARPRSRVASRTSSTARPPRASASLARGSAPPSRRGSSPSRSPPSPSATPDPRGGGGVTPSAST